MPNLENEIRALIVSALFLEDIKPEEIDPEEDLFGDDGLGLDSIDALELGVAIQREYGVRIDPDDPKVREYFRCVRSLARFVDEHRKA
jgi:acyl carrier protein